ncbi:MAG: hypothetical protein ACP6IU_15015 [Candidatus Asgardarchaeia archaeon]
MIYDIIIALELALIALYFIILYTHRKKTSMLLLLVLLLVIIQALQGSIDTVTAVILLFLVDFYSETRQYWINYVKRLSDGGKEE